jgi:hypothetical protein
VESGRVISCFFAKVVVNGERLRGVWANPKAKIFKNEAFEDIKNLSNDGKTTPYIMTVAFRRFSECAPSC